MKSKWLWAGLGVVAVAAIALTSGYRVESYSCAECRNCKKVETRSILGVDLAPSMAIDNQHPLPTSSHIHHWWRYASFSQRGVGGLAGKKVECQPFQYEDGRGPEALVASGRK